MTHYRRVIEFNKTFGVPVSETPLKNVFSEHSELVSFRMSLIREEMKELEEAVVQKDIVETVDALADLLYVIHGMGCSLGLNMDEAFDIVHRSNMSKLCKDEAEALETVLYYEANKDALGYDSPTYRLTDDGKKYVVFNASTGKVLKSINYVPAQFDYLINQETDTVL